MNSQTQERIEERTTGMILAELAEAHRIHLANTKAYHQLHREYYDAGFAKDASGSLIDNLRKELETVLVAEAGR